MTAIKTVGLVAAIAVAGWLWIYIAARLVYRAKWRSIREDSLDYEDEA